DLGTPVAPVVTAPLALADADYYRFRTTLPGGVADHVRIDFHNAFGDLALKLYRRTWNGVKYLYSLLSSAQTAGDFEQISLSGLSSGTFVVLVYGVGGAKNPNYSLTIDPP